MDTTSGEAAGNNGHNGANGNGNGAMTTALTIVGPAKHKRSHHKKKPGFTPGVIPKSAWKPGQSGNPAGRPPRTQCVTSLLRELLEGNPIKVKEKWMKEKDYPTGAMVTATAMFNKLQKGDMQAITVMLDRVEGKIADKLEVEDKTPQAPLEIELDDDKFAAAFSVLAKAGVTVDQIRKN